MSKWLRISLITLGAVALLVVLFIFNRSNRDSGISCETKKADYGSIVSKVSGIGELQATLQINLQAQVMGVVKRVRVEEGQKVRRGDTLLELDRQAYEAQLTLARAQFQQMQLKHTRVETLYAHGLISSEEYEASKTAYEVAEAQFHQAQDQFDKTVICAPISGIVTRLNIKEGETVVIGTMNSPGTVLLVIADLSRMQARIKIDETDVVEVKVGQSATVYVDALPDTSFAGHVARVGYMPVANLLGTEQTGINFEVEIILDSTTQALRPGMTVHADIITARRDSVLVVPIQAVGRRKLKSRDTETVFVVKKGRAVMTPVKTGKSSDTEVEIMSGLSPGDEVIIGPYKVLSKLTDGKKVRAEPTADVDKGE